MASTTPNMVSSSNNMPVAHNVVPQNAPDQNVLAQDILAQSITAQNVLTQNALTQNATLAQDNALIQNATLAQDNPGISNGRMIGVPPGLEQTGGLPCPPNDSRASGMSAENLIHAHPLVHPPVGGAPSGDSTNPLVPLLPIPSVVSSFPPPKPCGDFFYWPSGRHHRVISCSVSIHSKHPWS